MTDQRQGRRHERLHRTRDNALGEDQAVTPSERNAKGLHAPLKPVAPIISQAPMPHPIGE